jgi:hypothetical protein
MAARRSKDVISNNEVAVWVPIGGLIAAGVNTADDAGKWARVPGQGVHHHFSGKPVDTPPLSKNVRFHELLLDRDWNVPVQGGEAKLLLESPG